MIDILAALGAMIAWGFGDFVIQKVTRVIGDMEALAWIGVVGTIGVLPFVWHDFALVATRSNFLILLLLGVITFAVGIVNFEALKRGKISVIEVIIVAELPVAVLLGIFFLGESLSLFQTILVVLVFLGIVLIASEPGTIKKRHFIEKGAILAFIAAAGYGLIDFLTAVGAKTVSPLLTIWCAWATFTLICLVYMAWEGDVLRFFRNVRRHAPLIIGMGLIDTFAWVLFAFAVRGNELAITVAITESYPAIGLFLGVAVNREKVVVHQYVGAAIAVVASFAMGIYLH